MAILFKAYKLLGDLSYKVQIYRDIHLVGK